MENLIIFSQAKGNCKLFVPRKNTCFYLVSAAPKSSKSDLFISQAFLLVFLVIPLKNSAISSNNKHMYIILYCVRRILWAFYILYKVLGYYNFLNRVWLLRWMFMNPSELERIRNVKYRKYIFFIYCYFINIKTEYIFSSVT